MAVLSGSNISLLCQSKTAVSTNATVEICRKLELSLPKSEEICQENLVRLQLHSLLLSGSIRFCFQEWRAKAMARGVERKVPWLWHLNGCGLKSVITMARP